MSPRTIAWCNDICLVLRFTFENRVPLMRHGASVMWYLSFPLMNSFNKTGAAIFRMQAVLSEGFPFSQLNLTYYSCY